MVKSQHLPIADKWGGVKPSFVGVGRKNPPLTGWAMELRDMADVYKFALNKQRQGCLSMELEHSVNAAVFLSRAGMVMAVNIYRLTANKC